MSIIPGGVKLTGFIAPNDSADTFPVFKPIYGLGGLRTVDTLTDRNAITSERREEGMLVYVKEDGQYYQIMSGLTNADWVNLNLSTPVSTSILVSATGANNYSGTATPSITGYSIGTIYLTSFDTDNTAAATIDIDGLGVLDILKGNDSGLTSLDSGDIQTGVTYYLTYDGTQMQFFDSNPTSTVPNTYTNLLPTTIAVGGVSVGTTFSATPYSQIFDTMFYPTLVPNFTSFLLRATPSTASTQATTLEVGDSVCGGTRVFTWATSNSAYVKPNTIIIRNITGTNTIISTPTSGMTNDGNEIITLSNIQKISQASHQWAIYGTRSNNSTFSTTFTATWLWRRMFGSSSNSAVTTSSAVNAFSGSGVLTTTITGSYVFNQAGYKYFFVPTTFASPSLFKDASTQLAIAMTTVTDDPFYSGVSGSYNFGTIPVTNQFNITQNYRVYRSRNILNGNITITVS
jgi:hypothetical protein